MLRSTRRLKIYLAGPEVFLPDAAKIGEEKKKICAAYETTGLFPLDAELALAGGPPEKVAHAIYEANEALMRQADACIANLSPFRGPNVDDGTAFEVRAMIARGKPVYGYANSSRTLAERVAAFFGKTLKRDPRTSRPRAADKMPVEDYGLPVNLMLACGIEASGGRIVLHDAEKTELFTDLTAFESCVRELAETHARTGNRRPKLVAG